jgi:hypothetical protein
VPGLSWLLQVTAPPCANRDKNPVRDMGRTTRTSQETIFLTAVIHECFKTRGRRQWPGLSEWFDLLILDVGLRPAYHCDWQWLFRLWRRFAGEEGGH